MPGGSLTVVGTGIRMGLHLTPETRAAIDAADDFLYLAAEPLTDRWLQSLHPRASSLRSEYSVGRRREEVYARMVERMLEPVRGGRRVVAAFYGHPGVYVRPSNAAIRQARAEGLDATMLPAVSAEDCLFADLGVDPATTGCASYDATDFLLRRPPVDTAAGLILWQITVVGDLTVVATTRVDGLRLLLDRLAEVYPRSHEVLVYEASPFPIAEPVIERVELGSLPEADLTPLSTLYVPPATVRAFDPETAAMFGLSTQPTPTT
jgi:uncharacterized protein YabN with tetrapyrrole methylase and pyrophosphatase domain